MHHLRAHAPPADEEPLVHQGPQGLADRRPGQPEPPGEVHLVAEQAAGAERTPLDRRRELLGELVVERDGAAAVQREGEVARGRRRPRPGTRPGRRTGHE